MLRLRIEILIDHIVEGHAVMMRSWVITPILMAGYRTGRKLGWNNFHGKARMKQTSMRGLLPQHLPADIPSPSVFTIPVISPLAGAYSEGPPKKDVTSLRSASAMFSVDCTKFRNTSAEDVCKISPATPFSSAATAFQIAAICDCELHYARRICP